MKGLDIIRQLQSMTENADGNYSATYEYDENGRILSQTTTGSIESSTVFGYDDNDNIVSEITTVGKKKITKTYSYDINGNITKTDVTTEIITQ